MKNLLVIIYNIWYPDKKERDKMDAARQLGYHTIDDIYNLPDGQRAELIDGELYMMATPSTKHQRIVCKECTLIWKKQ